MTKYVNQDVFDASLMLIAAHKLETKSELEYQNMIWHLVAYYEKDYSGDYSFKTDLEKGVETVVKNFRNTRDGDLIRALKSGAELRMQLDDNMQKKSTLKKLFGGTAFTSGHPNPSIRLSSGVTNVTRILDAALGK